MPPLPNFFIVGAPKAGTTSLYHYLRQHPRIYLSPIKEPSFFASELRPENLCTEWRRDAERDAPALAAYLDGPGMELRPGGLVTDWNQYVKLFRFATEGQAIGEASVCYLWSPTAARAINERCPDARIVMILRNPADRAFSQYLQALSEKGAPASFGELIRARQADVPLHHAFYPFLEFGRYSEQVERFLSRLPGDRVRIYLYEDYVRNPEALLRDIFRLLQVGHDVPLDLSRRHREPRVPRFLILERLVVRPAGNLLRGVVPPGLRRVADAVRFQPRKALTMAVADRRFLSEFYEHDVKRLSQLIGRDLSGWVA